MLLKMAAAPVAIVAGHTASRYYEKYLRRNEVRHETIWLTGVKRSDGEMPCFWLEFEDDTNTIKRVTVAIFHPEGFIRMRSRVIGAIQRYTAFRERMIDFAYILAFGKPHLPCFLSTMSYHWQVSTDIVIPMNAFEDYAEDNDTLSALLQSSTLNTTTMNEWIDQTPILKAKKKDLYDVRKEHNVKSADASCTGSEQMCSKNMGGTPYYIASYHTRWDSRDTFNRFQQSIYVAIMYRDISSCMLRLGMTRSTYEALSIKAAGDNIDFK
jgi:Tfp pilus assembly major pilin PilA